MSAHLDRELMSDLSRLIAERLGLHFPETRWPELAHALRAAGEELGFSDPGSFARGLTIREISLAQIGTLASHLTVGETYFFREPESFQCLQNEILPPLLPPRAMSSRSLRMWSAGCCTGEEAYSLAITCLRTISDIGKWNVSILATDVNPTFLRKAAAGVFSDWSFRGAPPWLRETYFSPTSEKEVTISPSVKTLVSFAYLNLALDSFPSLHNQTNAMDVIFCRNVLMYFTPEVQRKVVSGLHGCLVDGGYLLVNPAEASTNLFSSFAMEDRGGVILFRKNGPQYRFEPEPMWSSPDPVPPLAVQGPCSPVTAEETVCPPPPVAVTFEAVASRLAAGDPTAADGLKEVAGREPDRARAPLLLARFFANQGRLEEALSWGHRSTIAERTNTSAHFLCATILQELGRIPEAVAAFGKVLYLEQNFILAHHALGRLYQRLGKERESRRHFALALELLSARRKDEVLAESGGLTCGRLAEAVRAMTEG